MTDDVGEELPIYLPLKDGEDDDMSTLVTRGLSVVACLSIVAGTTFGGLLPIVTAIASPGIAYLSILMAPPIFSDIVPSGITPENAPGIACVCVSGASRGGGGNG